MLTTARLSRGLVRFLVLLALGTTVLSCGTPVVEKVVETKIIEKEVTKVVEVEKKVIETVVVEKEVPKATPQVLVVGHHVDPRNLDPFSNTTAAFQSVTAATIEQFVYYSPDGHDINPGLALSWAWSDDGKVLELKLRQGVKFHNGEVFDAQAAKFNIELFMNSPSYSWLRVSQKFERAEVVNDSTVAIYLSEPAPYFVAGLARGGYVYAPEYYQTVGPEGFGLQPIGTGPYEFVEWVKDDHVTFKAFPDYWGVPPQLDQIVWRIIPEEAPRLAALEVGEVHLITNVSPGSLGRIESDPDLELFSSPGLRFCLTTLDSRLDYPISDPKVRRALNYAVDKQGLMALFDDHATPLRGQILPSVVLGYNPNVDPFDYDPDKAKELLAEAGYANGFELPLKYTIDRYALDNEMGETVAAYLEAVGIKVERMPLEYGEFVRQYRLEGEMTPSSAIGPAYQWCLLHPPDPFMTLAAFNKGQPNAHFASPQRAFDLLDAAAQETDPTKREAMYQEVMQIWNDEPIGIYLVFPDDLYATRQEVTSFVPRADQVVDLRSVGLTQ